MVSNRIKIGMGEGIVARSPSVITLMGLGSCVALTLYDTKLKMGGMAHIMFPNSDLVQKTVGSNQKAEERSQNPKLRIPNNFSELRTPNSELSSPFQCADTAITTLLKELRNHGAHVQDIVAKMAGGSRMFPFYNGVKKSVGEENIESIVSLLKKEGIPLTGKDVGGNYGRSMEFHLNSGRVIVRAIGREDKEI